MATISTWDQRLQDDEVKEFSEKLHDAIEGWGTNEKDIIQVLVSNNNAQRQQIKKIYSGYGDLLEHIKDDLSGDFETSIVALLTPTLEYEVRLLHDAINGPGTCENTLVGIICTRNNDELEAIKEKYKEMYDCELLDELQCDVSGDFGKMIYALVHSGRQEGDEDEDLAEEEAKKLIEAGIANCGTDESQFNIILCKNSYDQLRCIMRKYTELTDGNDLIDDIGSEFSGNLKDGYRAILKVAKDRCAYFAERIHDALSGAGTDEDELTRILVCRAEIDLEYVKQCYAELYGQDLIEAVDNETSGDYGKVMKAVVRGYYKEDDE